MREAGLPVVTDKDVYPPSEDTYLLLDAINLEQDDTFLEIGCGTGLISVSAARTCRQVVSLDISLPAVINTWKNIQINGLAQRCSVIQSDLMTALRHEYKFSMIAFNPPYLPYDGTRTDLDRALVGGKIGVEITTRFLRQSVHHLKDNGRVCFVVSSLGCPRTIEATLDEMNLVFRVVAQERYFYERISVYQAKLSGK